MAVLKAYPAVMTPAEVAEVLRLSLTGVRTLAARGDLPGHKIGREWRFLRSDIAAKLGAHHRRPEGAGEATAE